MSSYVRDLGERVTATFLQGFAGAVVITELNDRAMWEAAAVAGIAAVVSLVKGLLAKKVGNPDSASLDGGV